LLVGWLVAVTPALRASGPASAPATGSLHDQLITQYMDGKWEDLEKELVASLKEISAMPAAPRADVEYIRHALAEGRPAWWKQCKAGQRIHFKPLVWRETLNATYDPTGTDNQTLNFNNGALSVVVGWQAKEMDNPTPGEWGFTHSEGNELWIWNVLGNSQAWSGMSPHFLVKLPEAAQMQFKRFVNFRGNATALYYVMPRARRMGICSGIVGYTGEFAKTPEVMCRKAIAAMYVAEVLSHPAAYPSIVLPPPPPADGAEAKLVLAMQEGLKHNNLTFAEDRTFREAAKGFALANASEAKFRQTGKIVLPNNLTLALDPAADKPLAVQRDAWITAHYPNGH
jgi:hypothetical protein